jgi:hypothetical protein
MDKSPIQPGPLTQVSSSDRSCNEAAQLTPLQGEGSEKAIAGKESDCR